MKKVAKFLVALAGAGTQILSLGILSGSARDIITSFVAMITAIAVYLVPNAS